MTSPLPEAIASKWRRQGVIREPALGVSLDDLEVRRGIALPPAFRALYLRSDGTAAMDDHEFTFWPLDNIADDPSLSVQPLGAGELVIADYRLSKCVYSIRFENGIAREVLATALAGAASRVSAPSFDAFLEQYLADPRSLTSPKR